MAVGPLHYSALACPDPNPESEPEPDMSESDIDRGKIWTDPRELDYYPQLSAVIQDEQAALSTRMTVIKTTCLPLVLLYVFFSPIANASSASDAVQKLCDQLGTVAACRASIKVPTARVRYGTITLFRINSCKTKKKALVSRSVSPVLNRSKFVFQSRLDMVLTPADICKFATKAVPGLPGLVKKSTAVCRCILDAWAMIDTDTFKAVAKSKSVSESTGAILAKTTKFYTCAIDAGLNVQDNKHGPTQGTGALVTNDTILIDKLPLPLPLHLVLPLPDVNYHYRRSRQLSLPGPPALTASPTSFSSLSANTKSIAHMTTSIQATSTKIVDDFCPDANVFANNTLTKFKKQVESTLDISKQVGGVYDLAKGTVQDAKNLSDLISSTISFFEDMNDLQIETIHIPYVLLTLPQDSTLVKLGQDTKGATTSITWSGAKPSAKRQASSSAVSAASYSFSSSASVVSSSAGISLSEAASSARVTSSADTTPPETAPSITVTSRADTSAFAAAPSAAISSGSDSSPSDANLSVEVSSSTAAHEDISSSSIAASISNSPPVIDTTRRRAARRRVILYDSRQEAAEDGDDPVPADIDACKGTREQ
ncbi:hypothetical protein AYX14_02012 [Cryptococcus neoformans]|nr:hypothetical protein AYX14_02012 [Cryptococcus neoformans var. grubii]